jgi:hypothetical protein
LRHLLQNIKYRDTKTILFLINKTQPKANTKIIIESRIYLEHELGACAMAASLKIC